MLISLIIPCYNEQDVIPIFYNETAKELKHMRVDYELLFIDDGSRDNTMKILHKLAGEDSRVHYLSFSRNFGKEAAMYAGFCNVQGDYVVVMDADLQDPPSMLPQMLEILQSGEYDCVAARRTTRKGESKIRSWFARRFYQIINRISDADIMDGARDFRMMKREMADTIARMEEYNRFSKGIFGWVGFRTYWLPYDNISRAAGKTKWNFWKLFRYAVDGMISFSQVPLSVASWFGLLMTMVSFVSVVVIVLRRLIWGDPVAGWASTVSIMTFIGGIQLFCMGIMGQYISKIYMEVKRRPHYIIAESNLDHNRKKNTHEDNWNGAEKKK